MHCSILLKFGRLVHYGSTEATKSTEWLLLTFSLSNWPYHTRYVTLLARNPTREACGLAN